MLPFLYAFYLLCAVSFTQFRSLFNLVKLRAASRAGLKVDSIARQHSQVAIAVEGNSVSSEVVSTTLLPLLKDMWAKLPKKRVSNTRQGTFMAADATSACFILRNDSEVSVSGAVLPTVRVTIIMKHLASFSNEGIHDMWRFVLFVCSCVTLQFGSLGNVPR